MKARRAARPRYLPAWLCAALVLTAPPALAQRLDGFNIIAVPGHPFGSASARQSLEAARRTGASTVAVIPFLWQAEPASAHIKRGIDMSDDELRVAIRDARALGFRVVVKPHVWVPGSWAGTVEPRSEGDWATWFADYRRAIETIAAIAGEEQADVLGVGTELEATSQRPEWSTLIRAVRASFPRALVYFAHDVEEAERVPFWPLLDAIGVTLYPALGDDGDRANHLSAMNRVADRLNALSLRFGKPVLVGEIGLRSAIGAAVKPWESAEERASPPAPFLQTEVLSDWLTALDRPSIEGVLVWRWFTDPAAGGPADTDFTVQGKPAERALACRWGGDCVTR